MAKTLKIGGTVVVNLPIPDDQDVWSIDDFNESGSNQITGSLRDQVGELWDSKPTFGFTPFNVTWQGWDDIPNTWAPFSASLTGSVKTQICNDIPISESLFDGVYDFRMEDTEYTVVSGYGTYRKFRHFIDGTLRESFYIPSSSADTGSGIPTWDG